MLIDPDHPPTNPRAGFAEPEFLAEPIAAAERWTGALPPNGQRASLRELRDVWAALAVRLDEQDREVHRLEAFHPPQPRGIIWENRTLYTNDEVDAATAELLERLPDRRPDDEAEIARLRVAIKGEIAGHRAKWQAIEDRLCVLRQQLEETERAVDGVLDRVYAAPIETIEDVALLLDVALGREVDIVGQALDPEETPFDLAFTGRLLRALVRLIPGFEFTSLRRDLLPDQLNALMTEPAESDEAEAIATAAE